ncbi:conjugal transfer pilus assembly protein TraV [Providencia alcalifaciens]|uniref:Conjugal transfer pilus assembly protein TraV n=1 Tax=Providencia alcalifaciens TaxID=126385 RepID=A0A4R3NJA9_9GAMM|nr:MULTISPECIES: type IV conjugative transfer system lipoprotein TraV [Providencia]MBC5792301.1 type IV conjugative transfer system lipoprotein TraV [Providencia sp. JUb39]TCT28883.1 conjugal transfer pilus assembly protein TraV [Providencia alcalifaciens]
MKKLLILGALSLLAGCTAGLKDSFDCNAIAQDSCMTMEEANQRASAQTSPLGKSQTLGGTAQKRAELPRLAPLATPIVPVTTTATTRQVTPVEAKNSVTPAAGSSLSAFAHSKSPVKKVASFMPAITGSSTPWGSWGDIGMSPPQRLPTTTARLWIAPWVDEHDNLYQPAVVSFVVKDGEWRAK